VRRAPTRVLTFRHHDLLAIIVDKPLAVPDTTQGLAQRESTEESCHSYTTCQKACVLREFRRHYRFCPENFSQAATRSGVTFYSEYSDVPPADLVSELLC
jgi:hypothetical protein